MPTPDVPNSPSSPRSLLVLGGLVVVLIALWRHTPLRMIVDARLLADRGRALASAPAAPALVVAFYLAAGLVFCPITPLLAATALVFEPGRALALGLAGALASAAVGYGLGCVVGRRRPRWVESARFAGVRARLRRRGVVAMATVRLVPVGNFTLANVVAGAIGIPLADYMLGNALGLVPALLALTGLSRGLHHLGWPGA
jgi:phospholipase D1/2